MGGSGGSGSFFPSFSENIAEKLAKAKKEADENRLNSQVNRLIREVIPQTERDIDKTTDYLNSIEDVLKDESDMQNFLFGGSVAKHTYVDGLSDIDALVILKKGGLSEELPTKVLKEFKKSLEINLSAFDVEKITKGNLAITVTYKDGTEIQLLPAVKRDSDILISNTSENNWLRINPKVFQTSLTKANQKLNNALLPTIKLVKSIISDLPKKLQLTGYHTEALAINSIKGYNGNKTIKALLENFFVKASTNVLNPLIDKTGQSTHIDDYLGKKNSRDRISISKQMAQIASRMQRARTLTEWEKILEIE